MLMMRLQARKWNFPLLHVLKSALELEHNLIYILFISFNIHKLTSGYGWSSVGYLTVCARISRNLFDTQEILRFPLVHIGNYQPELMLLLLFWRSFFFGVFSTTRLKEQSQKNGHWTKILWIRTIKPSTP